MKVDFIIIGGQKCGSTALHHYLSSHPQIIGSNPKEIDYFNYDFNFEKGKKFYHSHFSKRTLGNYKYLESSPSYSNGVLFTDLDLTIARIKKYNHKIRLVYIVRNPIHRAYSAWNMYKDRFQNNGNTGWQQWFEQRTNNTCDFHKRSAESFTSFDYFVEEEMKCMEKGKIIECPTIVNGRYIDFYEKYKTTFNECFLLLENDQLENDTVKVLNNVVSFFKLKHFDFSNIDLPKIFSADYNRQIGLNTLNILQSYYEEPNRRFFQETGINYNLNK